MSLERPAAPKECERHSRTRSVPLCSAVQCQITSFFAGSVRRQSMVPRIAFVVDILRDDGAIGADGGKVVYRVGIKVVAGAELIP